MDQMDIDHTVDVPDTPDRLTTRGFNRQSGRKEENQCQSTPPNSLSTKYLEDGTRDQPMVIDSGSKEPSLRPPKYTSSSSNSQHPINPPSFYSSSSSSRKGHLFRRGVKEKNPTFLGHDSIHARSERPLIVSRPPPSQDGNLQKPVIEKRSEFANGASSSHRPPIFKPTSRNAGEETESVRIVGSRAGMKNLDNIPHRSGNGGSISVNPISSPRITRQKRLVRNGCISPNNIAKSKQLIGKDADGSVAFGHNNNGSATCNAPTVSINTRELVAEDSDSHKRKGKGVIGHPSLSKGPDFNMNLQGRSSMTFCHNAMDASDRIRSAGKSIEESGGWRSTRNRTNEINISSPNNGKERKEKGISVATSDTYPNEPISSEHLIPQPSRESVSHRNARLGQLNGPRSATDTIKRQKQGSTLSSSGECSTSGAHDPEVVFLCSSQAANSKSTLSSLDSLQPIIEVDEFSPELRHNVHDENARARQLEADERLARELQEQLYNETPAFGDGQLDEHIALALQQQEGSNHRSSRTRHPGHDARGLLIPNLHRQPQSRSFSNGPRRGSLSRASTLGRMSRMRSRFPGQPRTILPSRGRTSIFPEDMDVEMRMHILGAFEEFSELGVSPGILQAERDFNENDYEMLLALDENNDQHGGASIHQINGLPQSTVQCDNFEESCAICLDTPTIGDTIRHLPCLHKFHKECIDPWLTRKSSCPVCKCSIT